MCLPGIVSSFSDSASLCGDKRRKVLAKYSGYLVQLTGVSIKKWEGRKWSATQPWEKNTAGKIEIFQNTPRDWLIFWLCGGGMWALRLRACPGVSSSARMLRLANDSQAAAASPTFLISSMNVDASRDSWSDSGEKPLKQVSACPRMSRRLGLPGRSPSVHSHIAVTAPKRVSTAGRSPGLQRRTDSLTEPPPHGEPTSTQPASLGTVWQFQGKDSLRNMPGTRDVRKNNSLDSLVLYHFSVIFKNPHCEQV